MKDLDPLRTAVAAALAGALLASFGCANVIHGTTQKVSITSEPPGAKGIIAPTGLEIVTPTTVELRRKQNYTLRLEHPGYKPQNAYLSRVPSPAVHGNLLLGGLPGVLSDVQSGAAYQLTPDPLQIVLEPETAPPAGAPSPTTAEPPASSEAKR